MPHCFTEYKQIVIDLLDTLFVFGNYFYRINDILPAAESPFEICIL
jgi:hypothetical protein